MIYQYIIDPLNNTQVNITSIKGKKILNNYINILVGGGEKINLNRCGNKKGKPIGKGGYKTLYSLNCDSNSWSSEDVKFNDNFKKKNCKDSIIAITREKRGDFLNEIKIQELANGPNIFRYGTCLDDRKLYKIEDKFHSDLMGLIEKKNIIWNQRENFKKKFRQLIIQLKMMHNNGYGHYDIKPENILVKFNKTNENIKYLKLTDFGLSDKIPYRGLHGTSGFLDTETRPMNDKTDIFALGLTLLESFLNNSVIYIESRNIPRGLKIYTTPRSSETPIEWIQRTYNGSSLEDQIKIFKQYPIFTHLIYKMLLLDRTGGRRYTSRNRYNIEQILSHSFWKIKMDNEQKAWKETPEYQDTVNIIEMRRRQEQQIAERNKIMLERRKKEKRNKRNANRAKYGTSKRGNNCVCIGPCEHQGILDCIAGICTYTKKCPVDPDDCYGKKLDKC